MMDMADDVGGKLVLVTFLLFVTKYSSGSWFEHTGRGKEKHSRGCVSHLWQLEQ